MWFNHWEKVLELKASRGLLEGSHPRKFGLDEGIVGLAAMQKKSQLVSDVKTGRWSRLCIPIPMISETRSELAVPVLDEHGLLLGVLNLEDPRPGAFGESDRTLLERLAVQAVILWQSVDAYGKLRRQIRSLQTLSDIATLIQEPSHSLDTALRLLLTGITAKQGAAFGRAMLFLCNDEGTMLQGNMAIGAATQEEADQIWQWAKGQEKDHSHKEILNDLLARAAQARSKAISAGTAPGISLNNALRQISLPLEKLNGALVRCIQNEKPVIVSYCESDPFRATLAQLGTESETHPFVCVPLLGKERRGLGVLVADNRFLHRESEIAYDDVITLEAYASLDFHGSELN